MGYGPDENFSLKMIGLATVAFLLNDKLVEISDTCDEMTMPMPMRLTMTMAITMTLKIGIQILKCVYQVSGTVELALTVAKE